MGPHDRTQAYQKLRQFVESIGGRMAFAPGGGPGGVWEIQLHGKTARVEVRESSLNELDALYVPSRQPPETWDDFDSPGTLVPDVFWKLVHLVESRESP